MSTRIAETPASDRPRERLLRLGPAALTQAELLAIVLGTGTQGRSAPDLAGELLVAGPLSALARRSPADVARTPGVGAAKAARVSAALELGRRLQEEGRGERPRIRSPADVYRWFAPRLADLTAEEFHVLALDSQSAVLRDLMITRGILNSSLVHPREVFRGAIAEAAAGIIVVHNHPSGDPTPSRADIQMTQAIVEVAKPLGIAVHDHLIVGKDGHASLKGMKLI